MSVSTWAILLSISYLGVLFLIAWWGERRASRGKSLVNNPVVYALSLAVYCTAWTFYGSVGRAANEGIEFLTIYLGPTLSAPLWWLVWRKIIRICREQGISTLADFISARYGQSLRLSFLVTIVCIMGVVPYIALQLRAMANSLQLLGLNGNYFMDSTLALTFILGLFTVLFGSKTLDATGRHEGMVLAVAAESVIKLLAFLVVGAGIVLGLFGNVTPLFEQAAIQPALQNLFVFPEATGTSRWFWMLLLSMLSFLLLPRQFQVGILENAREQHLRKAMWMFPLYLFLINLFVLPIALAGRLTFSSTAVNPDTYLLALPLSMNRTDLALLAYIGGFSAATSMIIVSTIALSRMFSHNIIVPLVVGSPSLKKTIGDRLSNALVASRRINIFAVLLLAYGYHRAVSGTFSLVSIGLISFAAVAQFAPALFLGLFWKQGTKAGATASITLGFSVWAFTLVLPTLVGETGSSLLQNGVFGISWLRPYSLFGLETLDPLSHGVFWSLALNLTAYFVGSILSRPSAKEQNQAELFVDISSYRGVIDQSIGWKGNAKMGEVRQLLDTFLGRNMARRAIRSFEKKHQVSLEDEAPATATLVNFAEQVLGSAMGSASARVLIATSLHEEEITLQEVYDILRESQQLMSVNKALVEKSEALKTATQALQQANQQLTTLDERKDDFISTVTHEMRTPLTAIRAMAEILSDNPDMEEEQREGFLSTIVKETDRMNRLISQVLDLEKMDTGRMQFHFQPIHINELVREALDSLQQLIQEKGIQLEVGLQQELPMLQGDSDRLTQVVLNLVSNAVKFVPADEGVIRVTSYYIDQEIRIKVTDNGKGIAPEIQPLIFEKFYQAERQTVRKPKGSGLGLAISKRIVSKHGGRIWVESEENLGAKFCIALPLASTPVNSENSSYGN